MMKLFDKKPQARPGIFNTQKKPFTVYVAMCVHRDVKVRVFTQMRILERIESPKFELKVLEGDALIARSRSRIATDFYLSNGSDLLLFLDDDVIFKASDIVKIVTLAHENNLDIVGGAYVLKDEKSPNFAIRTLSDSEDMRFGVGGMVNEVRSISTGCMAIKKHVLHKMVQEKVVHLCYQNSTSQIYPFFKDEERMVNGVWEYLPEDWAFCARARDLGFKVWCDATTKLGHMGSKVFDWDDMASPPKQIYEALDWKVRINADFPAAASQPEAPLQGAKGETKCQN